MSGQIYQTAETITVNNHFGTENKHEPWIRAIITICSDSVHIYGSKQELLEYNNRLGTLTRAKKSDLINVSTVFKYLRHAYGDTSNAIDCINEVYRTNTPGCFDLVSISSNKILSGCAWPVLESGRLIGVVTTAGYAISTLRIKENYRPQSAGNRHG